MAKGLLLNPKISVCEIASRCGYENMSNFSAMFKREVGISPNEYRKNGGKIIYTTHGLAFSKDSGWKSKLFYGTTEWLCTKLCDKVITINHDDLI